MKTILILILAVFSLASVNAREDVYSRRAPQQTTIAVDKGDQRRTGDQRKTPTTPLPDKGDMRRVGDAVYRLLNLIFGN